MKMHIATPAFNKIKETEVFKANDKTVWVTKGLKVRRSTIYESYFDTWEDAKKFLLDVAQKKVDKAESRLACQKEDLLQVIQLINPNKTV